MNDDALDLMVAEASPVADADVEAVDLRLGERELLREIAGAPESRRRRGALRVATAVAAVAAATLAALVLPGLGGDDDDRQAFAAQAIRVAEANPRLLVGEPGWKVVRADEFRVGEGEMTFASGDRTLDVHWREARMHGDYLRDRAVKGNEATEITLLGKRATMVRYGQTTDFTTLLPADGPTFLEIRGDLGSRERYLEVLRSLHRVDVETWLSALPASVVQPVDRSKMVDELLRDVPLPPGLDLDELRKGDTVSDRYQFGAQVSGAVACGWLDRWSAAKKSGDAATVREAVRAMATSRTWPVLRGMNDEGDYPEVVWMYADQMAAGEIRRGDYSEGLGCP